MGFFSSVTKIFNQAARVSTFGAFGEKGDIFSEGTVRAVTGALIGGLVGGPTGAFVGATAAGGSTLLGGDVPSGLPVPTAEDVRQRDIASVIRRRALARGGRASTFLTEDTTTPLGQQIPASQIGRSTLLGGP